MTIPEIVPFTAQLIPIAVVNTGHKIANPARSAIKDLRGLNHSDTGSTHNPKTLGTKTNFLYSSLKMESKDEQLGILIDRSLSMGLGGSWDQLVREFDALPPMFPSDNRARIWLFDKDCEEIAPSDDWGTWNEVRLAHALRRIHETRPGGLTNLANAIRCVALRGSTRIVVVSDDAGITMKDWISIASTLRRLGRPLPRLCIMRLSESSIRNDILANICQQTGGWCRYPNQK